MATPNRNICEEILFTNSPWLKDVKKFIKPEPFRRQIYRKIEDRLCKDAYKSCGIFIKGLRRVGKTELQKQLIWHLMQSRFGKRKFNPKSILYLSFDDAQIQSKAPEKRIDFVIQILDLWAKKFLGADSYEEISKKAMCFFDEVQAVQKWEYLLKNKLDRRPDIPIIFSGSAAHTLFNKAENILLGRSETFELQPFSFCEYLQFNEFKQNKDLLTKKIGAETRFASEAGKEFKNGLDVPGLYANLHKWNSGGFASLIPNIRKGLDEYLKDGGFPQLWKMREQKASLLEQYQFMDENYVRRTTLEDLMLFQQIRKPELYERLFRHLFARPGEEYNLNKTASELGTTAVTMAEAMQLLRQSDLFIFSERYSSKSAPLKNRNVKIYPADLQLTTAVTKRIASLQDNETKGAVAETLVAQTLRRLFGSSYHLAFMRSDAFDNAGEVDFFLQNETGQICPIEVKYQNNINPEDYKFMKNILRSKNTLENTFSEISCGLIITPNKWDHIKDDCNIFCIPLWAFMLIA